MQGKQPKVCFLIGSGSVKYPLPYPQNKRPQNDSELAPRVSVSQRHEPPFQLGMTLAKGHDNRSIEEQLLAPSLSDLMSNPGLFGIAYIPLKTFQAFKENQELSLPQG